jgi:hypothetical protein
MSSLRIPYLVLAVNTVGISKSPFAFRPGARQTKQLLSAGEWGPKELPGLTRALNEKE